MALNLQKRLRNLCCNKRWCYAAFWKLQPADTVLLVTWENGRCGYRNILSDSTFALMQESEYGTAPSSQVGGNPLQQHISINDATASEVQAKFAVAKLSSCIYPLGKGIIWNVALTGQHQWLHAPEEADYSTMGTTDNGASLDAKPADFHDRFDIGIKTVAVVAVPHGVVELGSTHKMIEDLNFVSHIQASFGSPCSAAAAFGLDFLPKKERKPRQVFMSDLIPICRQKFTTLNGNVLCNCPFNYKNSLNGANLPAVEFSKKQASQILPPSQFLTVDEAVSSATKVPYNCSTEGDAIRISLSTLSSMSDASCGQTSESLHGCKILSKMDENFRNTLLLPSGSLHPIWDCLCVGELETSHKFLSADGSRFNFPDDTIKIATSSKLQLEDSADKIKVISGSNFSNGATKMIHDRAGYFLKGSSWHIENSKPQFLIKYKLSKILTPIYMKEKERAASTPGGRIEYLGSSEKFLGSNEGPSLQSFERMSSFYAPHSNMNAEALLKKTVADVAECFQLHPRIVNVSACQDLSSKSECVVSTQSTSSVNSCSCNNISTTAANQSKSKFKQTACKDRQSLTESAIKKAVTENFGNAYVRPSSGQSQFKLTDDTCIDDIESPQAHHQATIRNKKRSRPHEKNRQLIKDRLRKLRKIVPNTTRCSIYELLERTIEHMHFLHCEIQHGKQSQHVCESNSSDPNLPND